MPIRWTPEKDAVLLKAIFEKYNISLGCTWKAIQNRLHVWKSNGKPTVDRTTTTTTPSKKKVASSVRTSGGSSKTKGKASGRDGDPQDKEKYLESPRGHKRTRESDHDSYDDAEEKDYKKIKTEDLTHEYNGEGKFDGF
ncbi:hypothetical protein BS50DRAFT_618576 [Corynespora cassiicola Philippines]|uniref:Uncharacterized protein n=1 Tax=Corynespora cassiicola Philippines TaxID=1448308 RepID=A0A2T2P1U4_CORCC|nr:hypothetical protein BS50DRAFT_618576 [Corynespora cassiicola Philippines]